MDAYNCNPKLIPSTDAYYSRPLCGRYRPHADDYQVDPRNLGSTTPAAIWDWDSLLDTVSTQNLVSSPATVANPLKRNTYALGSVIVKTNRCGIDANDEDIPIKVVMRDYSFCDENEALATGIVRHRFPELRVPKVYFSGKIKGAQTLIEERLPGVALNVAWPYLKAEQRASFKSQASAIIHRLHTATSSYSLPNFIAADIDPVAHRGISEEEYDILFDGRPNEALRNGKAVQLERKTDTSSEDYHLFHNNLKISNIIVDKDKIVGIVGWNLAGYFAWDAVARVHKQEHGVEGDWSGLYDTKPCQKKASL